MGWDGEKEADRVRKRKGWVWAEVVVVVVWPMM
jgi:hypothetical protein